MILKIRNNSNSGCLLLRQIKERKINKLKVKTMMIRSFDRKNIVHNQFVLAGQLVNQQYYRQVVHWLRKQVLKVRPVIIKSWILQCSMSSCLQCDVGLMFNFKAILSDTSISLFAWSCLTYFCSPGETSSKRYAFWITVTDFWIYMTKVLQQLPIETFQKNWIKTLEPVYSCRRGLYWRRSLYVEYWF